MPVHGRCSVNIFQLREYKSLFLFPFSLSKQIKKEKEKRKKLRKHIYFLDSGVWGFYSLFLFVLLLFSLLFAVSVVSWFHLGQLYSIWWQFLWASRDPRNSAICLWKVIVIMPSMEPPLTTDLQSVPVFITAFIFQSASSVRNSLICKPCITSSVCIIFLFSF